MPFLPDSPLTIAYAGALAVATVAALWLDRRSWPVLAVMWANWLATRAITWADAPSYFAAITDLSSAAILIVLWRFRTMAVLPVAALFSMMVLSYGANDLGLIERETMWAFADVAAYLQLLLIIGISASGGRRVGAGSVGAAGRGGTGALAMSVAKRVPPPGST